MSPQYPAGHRHERRPARRDRRVATRRAHRGRRARRVRLRRNARAGGRAHRAVQARHRRIHRRGREGDVHLHRPGRRQPDAAARGHGRHGARGHLQRPAARRAPQAVVPGPDVPAREAAEGPLPPVQPDRRRGHRLRRARRRHRADRADRAAVEVVRHHAREAADQFAGHARVAQGATASCCSDIFAQHLDALDADSQRRLEGNPLRILDSKIPPTQAIVARCAGAHRPPGRRSQRALRRSCAPGSMRSASPTRSIRGWCAASTTTRARCSSGSPTRSARRTRSVPAAATTA